MLAHRHTPTRSTRLSTTTRDTLTSLSVQLKLKMGSTTDTLEMMQQAQQANSRPTTRVTTSLQLRLRLQSWAEGSMATSQFLKATD